MTDDHSLYWLINLCNSPGRLACLALLLQEYDFAVAYKSGRWHADVDCPCWLPLLTTECDAKNFDGIITLSGFPCKNAFSTEQQKDGALQELLARGRNSSATHFCIHNWLLYRKNYYTTGSRYLPLVPKSPRVSILQAMHDYPTSGHLGAMMTLPALRKVLLT